MATGAGIGFLYFAIRYLASTVDEREKARWQAEFSEFLWLMFSFLILLAVVQIFESEFNLDGIAQQYLVRSVSLIRLFHYMGREIMGSLYFLTYTFAYSEGNANLVSTLVSSVCPRILNWLIEDLGWENPPSVCFEMCNNPSNQPVLVILNFLLRGLACAGMGVVQLLSNVFHLGSVSGPIGNFIAEAAVSYAEGKVERLLSHFLDPQKQNLVSEFITIFNQAGSYSADLFAGPGMGLVVQNQFLGSLLNSAVFLEIFNYSVFSFYFFVTSPQMLLLASLFIGIGKLRRPGYILAATYFSFKVLFPLLFFLFAHPQFLNSPQWVLTKDSLPGFILDTSPGIDNLWTFEFNYENIFGENSECERCRSMLESIFPSSNFGTSFSTTLAEDIFLATLMKTRYFFIVEKIFLLLNVFTTGGSFLYALFASLSYVWGIFIYPAQGVSWAMKFVSLLTFFLFGPPTGMDFNAYLSGVPFADKIQSFFSKIWGGEAGSFLGNLDFTSFYLPIMGSTAGRAVTAIMTPGFLPGATEVSTIPKDGKLTPVGALLMKCLIQGFTKTADIYVNFLSRFYVVVFVYSFFLPALSFVAATSSALSIARQLGEEFYLPSIIGWM